MGSSALRIGGAAVDTGYASHRLLKTLKTFFRWCVGRAVIDFSPAEESRYHIGTSVGIASLPTRARSRYSRSPAHATTYGLIVEFLALTGQRREEVAQLK